MSEAQSTDETYTRKGESASVQKYLTFALDDRCFAIELLSILEIIAFTEITPIPSHTPSLRGILTLRSQVVGVLDLRTQFNMEPTPDHPRKCIIVLDRMGQKQGALGGFLVDSIQDIVHITPNEIATPEGLTSRSHHITGIARCNEQSILLINLETLLAETMKSLPDISGAMGAALEPKPEGAS